MNLDNVYHLLIVKIKNTTRKVIYLLCVCVCVCVCQPLRPAGGADSANGTVIELEVASVEENAQEQELTLRVFQK